MVRPSRLFWFGMALLVIAVRFVAFPIIEPENKENPGIWFELYAFSNLLFVPALALILLAGFVQIGRWWTCRSRR